MPNEVTVQDMTLPIVYPRALELLRVLAELDPSFKAALLKAEAEKRRFWTNSWEPAAATA